MAGRQALPSSNFSHTNPLNISETWTATKLYISMLQISNLAVSTYFFLLFPFLVFTKCQVFSLRVGRSRGPVLQSAFPWVSPKEALIRLPELNFRSAHSGRAASDSRRITECWDSWSWTEGQGPAGWKRPRRQGAWVPAARTRQRLQQWAGPACTASTRLVSSPSGFPKANFSFNLWPAMCGVIRRNWHWPL